MGVGGWGANENARFLSLLLSGSLARSLAKERRALLSLGVRCDPVARGIYREAGDWGEEARGDTWREVSGLWHQPLTLPPQLANWPFCLFKANPHFPLSLSPSFPLSLYLHLSHFFLFMARNLVGGWWRKKIPLPLDFFHSFFHFFYARKYSSGLLHQKGLIAHVIFFHLTMRWKETRRS